MDYARLSHGEVKTVKSNERGQVLCSPRPFDGAKELVNLNKKPTPAADEEILYTWTEDDEHVYKKYSLIPKGDKRPWLTLKDYTQAVQNFLDAKAQELSYDTIYTCIGYWNSSNEKFRSEARAASQWRDAVWMKCHEILNAWNAGTIEQPTVEGLLAQLPTFTWAGN